jgi:predicted ATPase
MNEQLIVKNFGPIKDATVDFKRVTVFIGPTGEGKSTLAKLAAIFRDAELYDNRMQDFSKAEPFIKFVINTFFSKSTYIHFKSKSVAVEYKKSKGTKHLSAEKTKEVRDFFKEAEQLLEQLKNNSIPNNEPISDDKLVTRRENILSKLNDNKFSDYATNSSVVYLPAERVFVSSIGDSLAGLMRDDIGLPKHLLEFINSFSLAKRSILKLPVSFININYVQQEGRDFIRTGSSKKLISIHEAASGIQSVTPMLILLEYLSRNTEQGQSFIIEEPELNLYPTAQQGLLNWLVEKCTKGENDLTVTTHSPYILSSCNLLLEAYKVAQQRPDLEEEIAAIVPKEYWLNPDEFAAYYVANGTVKPITDVRTHLIGSNELDAVSGDISDSFRKLLRLKKQVE